MGTIKGAGEQTEDEEEVPLLQLFLLNSSKEGQNSAFFAMSL